VLALLWVYNHWIVRTPPSPTKQTGYDQEEISGLPYDFGRHRRPKSKAHDSRPGWPEKNPWRVSRAPRQGDARFIINTTTATDLHCPTVEQDNSFAPLEAGKVQDVVDRGQSAYSQRRELALTPTTTCNPLLDLCHSAYGLSKQLVDNFASVGIKSIYPWQSECLLKSGALRGEKNLVYTAPTGGGKSLVADVLMLKKVIDNPGKKAMLVLPYVALVQEKIR